MILLIFNKNDFQALSYVNFVLKTIAFFKLLSPFQNQVYSSTEFTIHVYMMLCLRSEPEESSLDNAIFACGFCLISSFGIYDSAWDAKMCDNTNYVIVLQIFRSLLIPE